MIRKVAHTQHHANIKLGVIGEIINLANVGGLENVGKVMLVKASYLKITK